MTLESERTTTSSGPITTLLKRWGGQLVNRATLRIDTSRGIRAAVSFVGPLILSLSGKLPFEVTYAALAAQNIAMVDVRGAYPLRLSMLLAMATVLTASAGIGGLVAPSVAASILAAGVIASCGGVWRHLSSEYGMSLSISSMLVFLLAESNHATGASAELHALSTMAGALWGVLIQVSFWPIRPEHPIRRTIAETWEATATLFDTLATTEEGDEDGRHERVVEKENLLRGSLDAAYATLASARPRPVITSLGDLNTAAANIALAVVSFNTALEALRNEPDSRGLVASFQPALVALRNISRTVALAVVSQQPSHVATFDIRLRRIESLLSTLEGRLDRRGSDSAPSARLAEALRLIQRYLGQVAKALQAVVARSGERTAFSLELFDLNTWTLRPLATSVNFSSRVDPAIIRFSYRAAILLMIGVGLQKFVHFNILHLTHAYWVPFTMVVVLQPDFGATRLRAIHRMGGTVAGGLLAGVLLWLHLPEWGVVAAIAATCFGFGFVLRRNYGIAVVFVTLFIVLLTEGSGPGTLQVTLERMALTLSGGFLALGAAFVFWPVWEKERFGGIMAQGFRANADYLRFLAGRLRLGPDPEGSLSRVKQLAEKANSDAFSSLRRMISDPKNQQEGVELAAGLTNGNQRLTRLFNLFAVHLEPDLRLDDPASGQFIELALKTFGLLAETFDSAPLALPRLTFVRRELDAFVFPDVGNSVKDRTPQERYRAWTYTHLARASTELSALALTVERGAAGAFAKSVAPILSAAKPDRG